MSVDARVRGARFDRAQVLLLRDPPEERRLSMERFADALEDAFRGNANFELRGTAPRLPAWTESRVFSGLGRWATTLLYYPVAAARNSADLYHIIDQGYAHVGALLPHERTIATCHDLMLLRAEEGVAGFQGRRTSVIRYRWSTSYLRRFARVACDSESTRRDAIRLCGVRDDRALVVPPGVDHSFRPLARDVRLATRASLAADSTHLLMHVSTGHAYKNVSQTLRVLAGLHANGLDVDLVRVGKPLGPAEQALARDLGIAGSIVEQGIVSEERLVELYNAADLFLFPSHFEGFGWPPLEAMACGTPVLTSRAPSLVEIVESSGLTEDAEDTRAFVEAATAVLTSDEVARKLRSRGLARAATFTWQRTRDGYARLYDDVICEASEQAAREDAECVA